jgi:REP element-mobilizing transposase RayT
MPRRDIYLCAEEFYHLYNRGNNRQRVFYERDNYAFFLRQLWKYLIPVLDIVAYCLMPTHYHLLILVKEASGVSETAEVSAVSRGMQRFSISYTKAMNERYDRVGALFQGAFRAGHVDDNTYPVHLSRYIHLNPVSAGLVEHAEDWEFSSYRDYIGLRAGRLPSPESVLCQLQLPHAYREFVESYLPQDRDIIADLLFD